MKSKLLVFSLAATMVFMSAATAVMANKGIGHKAEHKAEMVEEFIDHVDATDVQKTQLKAIHKKYQGQMKPLEQSMHQQKKDLMHYVFTPNASKAEADRRMTALEQTKGKLGELEIQCAFEKKAVLTPEQQQKAIQFFQEKHQDKMDK